jgi:hypothetical protein
MGDGGFWMLAFYRGGSHFGIPGGNPNQMIVRLFKRGGGDLLSRIDVRAAATPVPVGQTFRVSMHATPAGARVWMDDALVCDTGDGAISGAQGADPRNVVPFSWGTMNTPRGELQMGSTWGGGNMVPAPEGCVIDYYRTAIWTT